MEESRKKTTVFILVASILVVSLGVAYAYWMAVIQGEGSPMVYESVNNLKITYTEEPGVNEGVITPGWKVTKTFTVNNESSGPFKFNIVIKNLENTFVTNFLQYKITSSDGYNMTDYKSIPKSSTPADTVLLYSVEVSGNTTQHYTIEFYYEDSPTVNQSEDIGKKFGGTLGITEGTIGGFLYEVLTSDNIYKVDSTRNTNTTEPIEGTTLIEGYTSTGKIYMTNKESETEDGSADNPIYYFAGNPSDNWVKFAGFYWRIIRTDATHGIKLLYAGTSPDTTEGYINNKTYSYGSSGTDENTIRYENALFKSDLENWYTTNISKYESLISTTAKYCNDTSYTVPSSGNKREYGARTRLNTNKTPTYKCPNESDNLLIKVGLMTADEVAFAGGVYVVKSPNTYYYRNSVNGSVTGTSNWWTFSPDRVKSSGDVIAILIDGLTYFPGRLDNDYVYNSHAIRPVITLSSEVEVKSGYGTSTEPYTIVGTAD